MNLLLAIHAEHKQRTGHDIFRTSARLIGCDVCLFIGAEKRRLDDAEREYFANIERQGREAEGWHFLDMAEPPAISKIVRALFADGHVERASREEHRTCMLGPLAPGAGQRGPGWVTREPDTDPLPIDDPIAWKSA